ncbi:MAG: Formyl transferase domain protein [Parcubacteria group bacterium GW2011_GWA2_51_10]|nr:MAG: Formyl transferase domain protein [Parcubacteria group bacterium GW2011_GWA2_51_10]
MGIVIVTIPGETKKAFAQALHTETNGAVDLVVIQKPRQFSLTERIRRLAAAVGWGGLSREIWYGFLLRINRRARESLEYFRFSEHRAAPRRAMPRFIEVDSINSDAVRRTLEDLKPDLLVVWGSTILERRLVHSAKHALNLHMGYCPHYRGALANQHAVLSNDYSKIGATIHYVNGKADAGDVIAIIPADTSKSPRELFAELNRKSFETYIEIASRLFAGETLPRTPQEHIPGRTLLLREWTPSLRYALGRQMIEWERTKLPAPKFDAALRAFTNGSGMRAHSEFLHD